MLEHTKWEAEGRAIQKRLDEVDREWLDARLEKDNANPALPAHHEKCAHLEDEWKRIDRELADHMRTRP